MNSKFSPLVLPLALMAGPLVGADVTGSPAPRGAAEPTMAPDMSDTSGMDH